MQNETTNEKCTCDYRYFNSPSLNCPLHGGPDADREVTINGVPESVISGYRAMTPEEWEFYLQTLELHRIWAAST